MLLVLAATFGALGLYQATGSGRPERGLITFPEAIDRQCNYGRAKLYDECGSQVELFKAALIEANKQGKTLLVSYGA